MGDGLAAGWRGGRRRWVWLAAAIVVVALVAAGVVRALTAGAAEKAAPPATVTADRGAVTTEVATIGTLQPAQTRSLSFAVAGTVETISVRAGTTVTPGQALAKVDDTDAAAAVDSAQDALDDAQSTLTSARASAAAATASPAATCDGADFAAAYPAQSPWRTPTASVTPRPTGTGTASPAPTKTVKPTRSATAPRTSAPAGGGGTRGGGGTTCSGGGTQNNGSGAGQSGAGQSGGGGDAVLSAQQRVTQATVTLQNAEDALDGATITAPIAGRILSVSGKVGSQVSAGSAFITLADVYDMQISADFPEADADRLAVKQRAVATLADREGQTFKATVVQVDPVGTSDGTMVRYGVLLSFVDPPEDLLVGQSANVRVTTGSKAGVLRVPSTAVHDVAGDTGTVLRPGGGAGARVKVGVGLHGDAYTEIISGLAAGDAVVRSW
jgi:multidrug efflux pump subunit AcrA (membrane-fusion protein)